MESVFAFFGINEDRVKALYCRLARLIYCLWCAVSYYGYELTLSRLPCGAGRRMRLRLECRDRLMAALDHFYSVREELPNRWFLDLEFGYWHLADFENPVLKKAWPQFDVRMTDALNRLYNAISYVRRVKEDRIVAELIFYAEGDLRDARRACRYARKRFAA